VTAPESIDVGIAHQIGHYADAVRVPAGHDQIFVSGTPGLRTDGSLPEIFSEEAIQAWSNVQVALAKAGAELSDIVSARQWLVDADDIAAYAKVRGQMLTHEPASMLAVIPALVWPNIRVEIEVIAVRPTTC
jgi:2-iminobutanoate/2-iminopropanoate deaminase